MQGDRNIIRTSWLTAVLILAGASASFGQPVGEATTPTTDGGESLSGGNLFPEKRERTQALNQARDFLRAEDYTSALKILQSLIDLQDDSFFYLDVEKKTRFLSHKSEAMRLLETLPDKGRDVYNLRYGLAARQTLKEALAKGKFEEIEDVSRRFFHSEAGYEASYLLAVRQMERGNHLTAALHFERLRRLENADVRKKFEPLLSLRTAVCWGRAGMPEIAKSTLVEFKRLNGGGGVSLGGRQVSLFDRDEDALKWLGETLGSHPQFSGLGQEQWIMFRGNPSRTAFSSPASPVWDTDWTIDPIRELPKEESEAERFAQINSSLRDMKEKMEDENTLMLPAGHPLIVGDVAVFRTLLDVWGVNIHTGDLEWRSVRQDDELKKKVGILKEAQQRYRRVPNARGANFSSLELLLDQRFWRDVNAGTLSSNGELVFAVEDLGFHDPTRIPYNTNMQRSGGMQSHNQLVAYDARTGKLKLELGGDADAGSTSHVLAGHFFLGPPLPLGEQLFCLVDHQGEILLVALGLQRELDENGEPQFAANVLWKQSLVTPRDGVDSFPLRRMAGLTPSYAGGVLVCPTTAGAVVAVDPVRRLLLWGYRYPTNTGNNSNNVRRFGGNQMLRTNPYDADSRWLDAAVTIADSRVILTPRDSNELHCVNILDGNRIWKKSRGQMLYVAGVHDGKLIMAGKSQMEALRLDDGKSTGWKQPTPMPTPSGRGFQTGTYYHMPLSSREIATIDLSNGRVIAQAKTRMGVVPGNLVSANGMIVSQSIDRVMGFKPLSRLNSEIAAKLQDNPNDGEALAMRGEIRLRNGDDEGGLADLRASLKAKPTDRARALVASVLLEGLRLDFRRYRKYAPEMEELLNDPIQQERFRRLLAAGLQEVGENQAAFREYIKLAGIDTGWKHEEVGGELTVRSDRWLQSRLATVFKGSTEDERKRLTAEIEKQFNNAKDATGPAALRRFVKAFGKLPVADPARRLLAQRLDEGSHGMELELLLNELLNSPNQANVAYATSRLANLFAAHGHFDAAAEKLAELEAKFPDEAVADGITGRQFAAKLRGEHPRIAAAANEAAPWPKRSFVVEKTVAKTQVQRTYPVEFVGNRGPHFSNWSFSIESTQQRRLVAQDGRGEVRWRISGKGGTAFSPYGNTIRAHGHLLIAELGGGFLVIDALARSPRVLWERKLYEGRPNQTNVNVGIRRIVAGGKIKVARIGPNGEPLGEVGTISNNMIVYQAGRTIFAADPLNGDVLWKRNWPERGSRLFGDDERVFVVPATNNSNSDPKGPISAMVLRASDGEELGSRPVADESRAQITRGGNELRWETSGGKRVLSYEDVWEKKTLWQKHFDADANLTLVEDDEVAVIEPEKGRLTIVNLDDGKQRVEANVEQDSGLQSFTVVRTSEQYLVMSYNPKGLDGNFARFNAATYSGALVNGFVYGVDRKTGKKTWATWVEAQTYDDGQPRDLPLLVLSSRRYKQIRNQNRGVQARYSLAATILDVRNGRVVADVKESISSMANFELTVERERNQIKARFYPFTLTMRLAEEQPLAEPSTKVDRPQPKQEPKPAPKDPKKPVGGANALPVPGNAVPAAPPRIQRAVDPAPGNARPR